MKKRISTMILSALIFALLLAGCGVSIAHEHDHDWQEATCIKPQTCKNCGATNGSALGHDWQEATCVSPKRCSVCGKTEGGKAEHIWGAATCTEREKCAICGKENIYSSPLGHDWMPATIELPWICKRCGAQDGEPIPLSSFNRGHFDRWKSHPSAEQYVGMSGYVAVTHCSYLYSTSQEPYKNDWLSGQWYATIYEKDRQFYNAVGKVEHKLPVTVVDQDLTDWKNRTYSYGGFLLVERIDNGEQFYISVTDFVTEAYWENKNAGNVGYSNPCLAVYHQISDYYPVDRDNRKYDIRDSEVVLIYGDTQWGGINRETNQLDILGKNGRGFFNVEDLTIIY